MQMQSRYMWHGSDRVLDEFGGDNAPDTVHLGTLEQAAMRSAGKNLHLVRVPSLNAVRAKDSISDDKAKIARAKKKGVEALAYLNRYEGIDAENLSRVLDEHPEKDLDKIPDSVFQKLFPEAQDSVLLLDSSRAKIIGSFDDPTSARAGYMKMIEISKGCTLRKPASELEFDEWIRIRNPRIISEADFTPRETRSVENTQTFIQEAFKCKDIPFYGSNHIRSNEIAREAGISFYKIGRGLIAVDTESDVLLGGVNAGMIFVDPAHRGKGVATALHICVEETRATFFNPSHFSTGGFAARQAAHRELCKRAYERGEPVAEGNMQSYGLESPEEALCAP